MLEHKVIASVFFYFSSYYFFLLNFTNIIKHGFKLRTNVEGSKKTTRQKSVNVSESESDSNCRMGGWVVEECSEKEVCIFKNTSDVKMYWFGKYFGHKTRWRVWVSVSRWQRLCDCLWNGSHMVRAMPKKNAVPHFSVPFCRFLLHLFPQRERESSVVVIVRLHVDVVVVVAAVAMLVIR